uniref:PDZ domain-containing protein n=2 Tax=Homalodisca liturata TaxID=320908 RepID=A0A1B6JBW2_9HEMI
MGSNMSRHSGKGLTGRRSQSSGNLCNGKVASQGPGVARFFSPCGRGNQDSVGPRDRYKFCGSLPNHLDAKDPALEEVSEMDDDSSYRNNNNVRHLKKNDVLLKLQPLVPRADSVTHDQGYASERSPEDELPPDLPPPGTADQLTCPVHHPASKPVYPFLHKNSTFTVTLVKGTRGLGLSVTGGVDTEEQWPGLIRVKRLFPHQPAWQSGQLAQGDFLLVANNTSLVGLTNYEALEVLRTAPTEVVLTVCRPPPELQVLSTPLPAESAPVPPRRDPPSTSSLQLPLKRMESFGEFEITLKKVNGSLGFTLRKEDESVLGHYVRALVREPVLSDGRVKPGDKIVAVNGVDMSPMSHEEAVTFLRQCGQEVHLKLYRDPAQTPVQALSPTEHHRTFKPILRKEAQDMLSDLAVKKSMSPKDSSGSSTLSSAGRTSSPRKRRLTKTPSPDLESERPENHLSWSDEVLERVTPGFEGVKPRRPDTLNFAAERKPHFQFSAGGSSKTEESLDSLDSLDCRGSLAGMDSELGVGPLPSEPVSMPPLLTSTSDSTIGFSYRNPAYRSANPAPSKSKSSLSEDLPENRCSDNDLTGGVSSEGGIEGSKGLLKWKGVVFTPEDGTETVTSPEDSISQITEVDTSSNQVLVVELNRGWNSRLGFSLQQSGRNTLISAIHPDSVASRDGRLRAGDQLIMVNDESVEGMSTTEVISLLRKIRGSICITVWRKTS